MLNLSFRTTNDKGNFVDKAKVIVEGQGSTYNVDTNTYTDIDYSTFSDEELSALGIDPASIEREEEEKEEVDDEPESLEDDSEEEDEEDDEDNADDSNDGEEDAEGEDEDEEPEKDIRIPKARFDEAVQKERQRADRLEEQLNKLLDLQIAQTSQAKTPEVVQETLVDVDQLEADYADALITGEIETAVKIKKQINEETQKLINKLVKDAKASTKDEVKAITEEGKFAEVVAQSLIDHPELDVDSETYNEELVVEINALASGYQSTMKLAPSEALQKAVDKLTKAPRKVTPKKNEEATKRKSEKAKKMAKEPPRSKASKVADITPEDIDWEKMSDAEFERIYKKNPEMVENYLNGIHL